MDDLRVPPDADPAGVTRGAPFEFAFDGVPIAAHRGETVAAALLASGRRTLRTTRGHGRPRGLFCGIGTCFDCLVVVDGAGPVRACVTPARPGIEVETHRGR